MRAVLLLFSLLLIPLAASSDDWDVAERTNVHFLMRHALAPGTGDPVSFRIDDCSTQRNLDERGKDQAEKIGAALRDRGIEFDHVWTSQWCRCLETAELLDVGAPKAMPALNSFFADRSREPEQTSALKSALRQLPDGERVLMVTHQVNITALTGIFPASGEIVVVERRADDTFNVVGRVRISP